ncbi:MAG: dihydrolipoyl dehydrogenase [Pseudomonadota bacterium]
MRTLKAYIEDPTAAIEGPHFTAVRMGRRVTVIGGGVGGYPAAIVAARLGGEVTLIEKDQVGGTCLNWGCIPTKSLLQSCQVIKTIEDAEVFGVTCDGYNIDFKKIMNRKDSVVGQLRKGVEKLLEAKKVRIVKGTATVVDPSTVKILDTQEEIKSDSIIIATGSTPRKLEIEGAEGPHIWDSNDFFKMEKLPKSVVIIGGGFIGVEFAQILNRLNVDVTILEVMENLVPGIDKEVAVAFQSSITEEGIKVFANVRVEKIGHHRGKNTVSFHCHDKAQKCIAEKVIYSVGREPDLSWIDLNRLGLAQVRGALMVNERMETNIPNIYAVGDVVGGVMLAHVAIAEGECAARNAMGRESTISYRAIPSCIYTSPEVGSVGLSEEEADKKFDIQVGRFSFHGCGKALILNQTYGMVKVISERKSGTVLGVHIIGPHATDMIAEAVLGMSMKMTVEELAHTVHPHPTLSDAVMESAMSLCGGAIHMP